MPKDLSEDPDLDLNLNAGKGRTCFALCVMASQMMTMPSLSPETMILRFSDISTLTTGDWCAVKIPAWLQVRQSQRMTCRQWGAGDGSGRALMAVGCRGGLGGVL